MSVKTISREELKRKLDGHADVQVVNVLDPKYYEDGVIPGSIKIPVAELEKRIGELDKQREVITYCAGPQCSASKEAAEQLAKKGFRVQAYVGGLEDWESAGLPMESHSVDALEQPSGLSGMPSQ